MSLTNDLQDTGKRISDLKDMVEEIDTLVKENIKSKKSSRQKSTSRKSGAL